MGIHYIDGIRLKKAIVAGAQRVIQLQEHLNNINVFPVADGDTGTNMALTLKSVAEGVLNSQEKSLGSMSLILAESALMGARGNSGAILAQFFQGLADSFEGKTRASLQHFAEAAKKAVSYARDAISEPKEGTILTVLHDWSTAIQQKHDKVNDFIELISTSLDEAKRSLKETPKKLKVLAQAGVVDAGAKGFVEMLEGVHQFLHTGKIEPILAKGKQVAGTVARVEENTDDITFRYCTECFLRGDNIVLSALRQQLAPRGNSLIVAGNSKNLRVHIHTNEPEDIFQFLAQFGDIVTTKYEDMWAQHKDAHGTKQASDIALITDSTCDLPNEYLIRNKIRVVPLTLNIGSESYLDRVTITNKEFYRIFSMQHAPFSTSQPSPADFKQTFLLAHETHKKAIAILLASTLSGTYQAGLTAANAVDMEMVVVDSRTLSGSLGLLVMIAVEAIREGCSLQEIKQKVEKAKHQVKMYISVETMEYLVRGGRVSRTKGLLARLLGLQPVLCVASDGKPRVVAKTKSGKRNREKTLELVKKAADGLTRLRFIVCHAAAHATAESFAVELKRYFEIKEIPVLEISPALGAHAGPGTVAVSMFGEPQ